MSGMSKWCVESVLGCVDGLWIVCGWYVDGVCMGCMVCAWCVWYGESVCIVCKVDVDKRMDFFVKCAQSLFGVCLVCIWWDKKGGEVRRVE